VLRGQVFGGYFQWVLDTVCETVEWPYQPLGFDYLALRSALGPMLPAVWYIDVSFAGGVQKLEYR